MIFLHDEGNAKGRKLLVPASGSQPEAIPHIVPIPGEIWQCPDVFWVVTRGVGHWHLQGRDRGSVKHPAMHRMTPR